MDLENVGGVGGTRGEAGWSALCGKDGCVVLRCGLSVLGDGVEDVS